MAYATASQLCQQFDRRDIAGMCAESDTPVPPSTVEQNSVVEWALEQATGEIKSAACIANKYPESVLDALADSADAFLVRLTCSIAMGALLQRRSVQRPGELPSAVQEAKNWLAALRLGEAIFDVDANKDKGNVQVSRGSVVTLANDGFITAKLSNRWFPTQQE